METKPASPASSVGATMAAHFFPAPLVAIGREEVTLEDIDRQWREAVRRAAGPIFFVLFTLAVFITGLAIGTQNRSTQLESSTKTSQSGAQQNQQEGWWQRTTDPVAIFTFCLVVVGSFQLGLFLWQLRLIRESLDDAKIAADAAKESADAANRSATLAEKGLIAAQRAWIKIERIMISQPLAFTDTGVSTAVSIRITNIGNAPAL